MNKRGKLLQGSGSLFPETGMPEVSENVISLSLLFSLSFIYYYFFGEGIFFHQEANCLFIYSKDYFEKFSNKPGGLLNWAGNFLVQFYYNSFYGTIIISSILVLIFIFLKKVATILNQGRSFPLLLILLPSCLLLLVQTHFDVQIHQILGFIVVLALFLMTITVAGRYLWFMLIVLVPVLYYLAGSFIFVFLGLYIIYCLFYLSGNLRFLLPASVTATAAITFLVFKDLLFLQPERRLLAYPLFLNESSGLTFLFFLFAGFLILFPLLIKLSRSATSKKYERFGTLISMLAVFSLSVIILVLNYDRGVENLRKIEKMVYNQEWDEVIRMHEKLQSSNIVEQYFYNLALAERGQLCNRMFFGRQSYGPMSLTLARNDEQAFRAMYLYYAVGLNGEAHHLAYELMVQHGYRPENIKMLIKTELINGNYKVAERYINVLRKTLHYKKWAEKYAKMLFKPDLINSDPELGEKIRLLPKNDFFVVTDDFGNIDRLLKENPHNRIAFEYKIARLLLEKDLVEIGPEIKKLKGLGYEHIPRHIEEAVVSLVNVTGEFPDLGGLLISQNTDQRFIAYFKNLKPFNGNRMLIEKGIKKAERNTYWYYLQFGLVKSDFVKTGPVDYSIY